MQSFEDRYGDNDNKNRYANAVADIGLDKIEDMLIWDRETLKAAYEKDKNFNSIPIKDWNHVAGFNENTKTGEITHYISPLKIELHKLGITGIAPSQLVCILKEGAKQIVLAN